MSVRVSFSGIFLFFFVLPLYSNPFESEFNFYGLPYLIFTNPALLSTQDGNPSGVQFYYNTSEKEFGFKGASILTFKDNSFSLGYVSGSDPRHRVYSAYSYRYRIFHFGSSYSVSFFPDDPSLTVDFGAAVNVSGRFISLTGNNLIGTDSILSRFNRKVSLSACGVFPYLHFLGFDCAYYMNFFDEKEKVPFHGGRLLLAGKGPTFFPVQVSLGIDVFSDKDRIIREKVSGSLGFFIKIGEMGTGIFSGAHYDLSNMDKGFYGCIFFNPTLFYDRTPPVIDLEIYSSEEQKEKKGIYLKIICYEKGESSGIKNWTVVFSTLPSKEGEIIKTFSGGNLPPSTVYWDRKDSSGRFLENEKCYVRIVVYDRNNNVSVTPWKVIDPVK